MDSKVMQYQISPADILGLYISIYERNTVGLLQWNIYKSPVTNQIIFTKCLRAIVPCLFEYQTSSEND